MFEVMINHLYITFYNKILGTSLDQWIPAHLNQCRQLIHKALRNGAIREAEFVDGEVVNETWILHHFDFATFWIFGFLDNFVMPTARPGNAASRVQNFTHDVQQVFYLGYLCCHDLKARVVYIPTGVIGSIFITELCQNNNVV